MRLNILPFVALATAAASPEWVDISRKMGQQEAAAAAAGVVNAQATITVPLYIHIVAASTKLSDGYATKAMVDAQVKAMNKAYNPQGVIFKLSGTDWTINKAWAVGSDEVGMGKKLRKGSYGALNLYFHKSLPDNILGFCYFPVYPKPQPGTNKFVIDGCKNVFWSMPGGSPGGKYNLGATAVHEAGHWFGLLHTFQGSSCTGSGDFVADTPIQSTPSYGCQPKKDSCPKSAGLDNVRNYMDYSDDSCFTGFTAGQKQRLFSIWNGYRK
ncbi:extracellular metalloprotease [Microdochium bolleyi]|uniref:Extracellular metalloprotease n=1 Tax=Microdochium bolleyi TaxID=196109 RepID=A0A136IM93_9PEZI|nr:extracellular metalloprotease [Microdochium bolleyi]